VRRGTLPRDFDANLGGGLGGIGGLGGLVGGLGALGGGLGRSPPPKICILRIAGRCPFARWLQKACIVCNSDIY